MLVGRDEFLVKITSAGTVSIPKQFRRHMDIQKGDYVKIVLEDGRLVIRKVSIS
jgi:AbrB family looped-hinge helix DNA binding protein